MKEQGIAAVVLGQSTTSVGTPQKSKARNSDKLMALQFLWMDLFVIVFILCTVALGLRYIVPSLNEYYNVPRFTLKIVNLFAQALIPLTCIYFNNPSWNLMLAWKKKIKEFFGMIFKPLTDLINKGKS